MGDTGDEKLFEMLFFQMVMSLNEAAMMQMGKIVNPATGKVEKNLTQAQGTIDLLRMLKEKTQNNLTTQEKQMLEQSIMNLQMNFVYEKEQAEREAAVSSPENQQKAESEDPISTEESIQDGENGDRNSSPGKRPGMNN